MSIKSIAILGDFVIDVIDNNKQFGGGAYYVAKYLNQYGNELRIEYIDANYEDIISRGNAEYQKYLDEITFGENIIILRKLDKKEELDNLLERTHDMLIVTPAVMKINENHLKKIDAKIRCIDVQGFLRQFDKYGKYKRRDSIPIDINGFDVVKLNKDEKGTLDKIYEQDSLDLLVKNNKYILLTDSENPVEVFNKNRSYKFRVGKNKNIRGHFGDGDTLFASTVFHMYSNGLDIESAVPKAIRDTKVFLLNSWRN